MSRQKKTDRATATLAATNEAANSSSPAWSPVVRAIVSLLIVFHLSAVVIAPLSMMMPTASLIEPLRQKFEPYHQLTYLGHGYQFFAPDPGPSHFVQYRGTDSAGNNVTGHFPNRDKHWPRLHYHRWFMFSERLYELNSRLMSDKDFAEMIANMNRDIATALRRGDNRAADNLQREQKSARETHLLVKQQAELLTAALKKEIERKFNLSDVEITCVERLLPAPFEISEDKRRLDDEIYLPEDRKLKLRSPAKSPTDAEEIK